MKTLEQPAHSPRWFRWLRRCGLMPLLARRAGATTP